MHYAITDKILQLFPMHDGARLRFGAVLPDRHDGGGRGRGAADGAQQQCKRHGQAEYEDHRQRDGNGGTQRLGQCDSQHLSTGTL